MIPIRKSIEGLGKRVVDCKLQCKGITNSWKKGIPPRTPCLDFPKGKPDVIIIGMNPGHANPDERKYYKKVASKSQKERYDAQKCYFYENFIDSGRYFGKARQYANKLEYEKILWTNLCKCENNKKGKVVPPIQTFRTCMKKFLNKEVECFPRVPIIALGWQAFNAVSYRFPDRFVIGMPHSSGSWGNILKQFVKKLEKKDMKTKIERAETNKAAIWLPNA